MHSPKLIFEVDSMRSPSRCCESRILCFSIGLLFFLSPSVNLTQQPGAKDRDLAFEVASVKPFNPAGSQELFISSDARSFSTNMSLARIIQYAFRIQIADELIGVPNWARNAQFAINAKTSESIASQLDHLPSDVQQQQIRRMVQGLLVERFGLQYHRQTKVLSVYSMIIAKGGLKMQRSQSMAQSKVSLTHDQFNGKGVDVTNLVRTLSNITGRLVVNDTGLTGRFDVSLNWTPDMDSDTTDGEPSLFTALQEQLGLKLQSKKEEREVLIVDHVESPTPN
jgi:uncharacterized protein (TIGR03435 family)